MSQQDELAAIFVDEFLKTPEGQEWLEWAKVHVMKWFDSRVTLVRPAFLDEEQWERITKEWNKI